MTTSVVAPEITTFAREVRAALADLPAEEVDDLTEGLEADLAESLAEDLRRTLPDPVAYAAELRAAAGLPGRTPSTGTGVAAGLASTWRSTLEDVAVAVRRSPVLSGVADFAEALRPAWWVLRAWVATWLLAAFFGFQRGYGFDGAWWVVLLALAVVSVQWGRGRWGFAGLRGLVAVGNVVAVVGLLLLLDAGRLGGTVYVDAGAQGQDLTGVYLDGSQVTNVFGYDADGKPLRDVQLFDQDGRPLRTSLPGGNGCLDADCQKTGLWVPSTLRNGTVAWNVFPLRMVEADEADPATAKAGADPQDRVAPFAEVPALVRPQEVAKAND